MVCADSGAPSPVEPRQRLEGTKSTFTEGLQNVSPHSEMPDVLSGLFRHHTLLNLSDYTRLCAGAQLVPNSTIFLLPPPPSPIPTLPEMSPLETAAETSRQELPSPKFLGETHWQE